MQASQQLNKAKFRRRVPSEVSHRLLTGRASSRQRLIAGLVFFVVAASFGLFALAAHDKINMGWLSAPCGFKQEYGLPCPTCGMTTSALVFVQGKIFESFYIQPAAALLCSILVIAAFFAFFIAVFGVHFGFLKKFFTEVKIRHIILALIIIIAAGWAVTLARTLAVNSQG